jgi:hypothetical protein
VVESEALTLRHDDDFDAVFHFNETKHLGLLMQFGNSVILKHQSVSHSMLGQMSMFYIPKTIAKSFAIYGTN